MTRRNFGIFSITSLAMSVGAGFGLSKVKAKTHLRPPGAVERFESLCVKCGQCVQVCPYHSIKLLGFDDGLNLGTAFIDAKKRGCYLCDLFPCVLACPSGALSHEISEIKDVKMGVALLKSAKSCLAFLNKSVEKSHLKPLLDRKIYNEREQKARQILSENEGEICALCVNSCPVPEALKFVEFKGSKIPQVQENCVGCGVCEELCVENLFEIVPNLSFNEIYKKDEK